MLSDPLLSVERWLHTVHTSCVQNQCPVNEMKYLEIRDPNEYYWR